MAIFFYKEFGALGYLASYSPHGFDKDGFFWKTVEHYYQAQKFHDLKVRKLIMEAKTPKEASAIGRSRKYKLRDDWENIKNEVMYEAVLQKFKAHPNLKKLLLDTGDEEIIEETVKENYWGCGPNRDGQNHFGKILCKVRDELKGEEQNGEVLC